MSDKDIKKNPCDGCMHFMVDEYLCKRCLNNGGKEDLRKEATNEPAVETESRLTAEAELNYVIDAIHLYAQECASMNGAEFVRTMMLSNINLCRTILTEATINGATKEIVRGVMEAFKAVIV